jgi:hypothetical protein
MVESGLSDLQQELLARLLARIHIPVFSLPYTAQFEKIYADFVAQSGTAPSRYVVWTALVTSRQASQTARTEVGTGFPVGARPVVTQAERPPSSDSGPAAGQGNLFDLQPWNLASEPKIPATEEVERKTLLAALSQSVLGNMEQRLAYILQRYPETRDSDTALAIRYWTMFQAEIIETWDTLSLDVLYDLDPMGTISRIRRHIQNDLRLFASSGRMAQLKDGFQMELSEYLAAGRAVSSEIRFYLDETGNEGGKSYTGVAGLCVMEWKQYEKHWAALANWRSQQGWPETIHFVDTGSAQQPKALALMDQLGQRRSGLLFVGYALPSRGNTHQALVDLFIQLVIDSLRHMNALGCLDGQRALTLVKEADSGFDAVHLEPLRKFLAQQLGREFPDQVFLKDVEPIPKGREVMLECADLIAGGMQRRALYGGRNPKDILAEAVFNVTGFEDVRDNGTVFKAHPV